ncbi:hypothetical protein [Lichenibacterium ramalinae]|uniref:Uncharacterized protein n=1 Tax=Lichenibacterium ramalinae TaxID=2316527 RepID=A0A4Q2R9K3_9HYPH|nr:hypothetical protein [Lichenibacterium ramalinae]RYB03564.1 hypothetical protein D3272_15530 [Lichenibacterium ramalinae]
MFRFLKALFSGVARGLGWALQHSLGLFGDLIQSPLVAWWRHICPPPVQEEESTADVLRQVAGMIAGQQQGAEHQAETERPAPRPARHVPQAVMQRRLERALAYTQAVMTGDRLPSLDNVGVDLARELGKLRTPADAEPMHREIMQALGMSAAGWERPRREVLAPGPNHDETPALRYA